MNQKTKPFNMIRAVFYLIAGVIASHVVIISSVVVTCEIGILTGRLPVGSCKEVQPQIFELLAETLIAALALINVHLSGKQ